jgi:hypothetical protein
MFLDSKHEDYRINSRKMRLALIRRHLQVFALLEARHSTEQINRAIQSQWVSNSRFDMLVNIAGRFT